VAALQNEVRDAPAPVDDERVDVAGAVSVRRHDRAVAADLHLPFRDPVEGDGDVVVEREQVRVIRTDAREDECALDPDVPVGIVERHSRHGRVEEVLHVGKRFRLGKRAGERDPRLALVTHDSGERRRHEPPTAAVGRLDDQVGQGLPRRVDDDVGEFAERPVRAHDLALELDPRHPWP
jgi:hypothetical protein